jgi:PAS domain S-box-containing protein
MDSSILQENEKLFSNVLRSLSDGIIVTDHEGRFVFFNPAAENILGIGARDLDPTEWTSIYGCYLPDKVTPFPPDHLPLARALHGELIQDELIFVRNSQRPDGIWISVSGEPCFDEHGDICGATVIFRDITKNKMDEEHHLSTSQGFAALVGNQKTAILVENEKRKVQLVNQAFIDFFSLEGAPSDLVGMDFANGTQLLKDHFCDPDEFERHSENLLKNARIVLNERHYLKDGSIMERDYIPVFIGKEKRGQVWQYRDITEREQTWRRMEFIEQLSQALEQTADAVMITNTQGEIEYVNMAFELTTGFSFAEAKGKTPAILKSGRHDPEFYEELWNKILSGKHYRGTIMNRKKSGELYWSQQTITPITNHKGQVTHFVSMLKDITELLEKKEHEVEMRLAREIQQQYYKATASESGFDIAGVAYPADETGGDYFDFIKLPNGNLCIIIGDASGHGISSALVMAATRAYIRAMAVTSDDPGEILTLANRLLGTDLDNGRFMTVLMMCIDPANRTMRYVNAGHEYGYLLDKSGKVHRLLESDFLPLGLMPDTQYQSSPIISLEKDQIVVLLTDGIFDALAKTDTEYLAIEAINHVNLNRHKPAQTIAEELCRMSKARTLHQFNQDDVTSIILKVL